MTAGRHGHCPPLIDRQAGRQAGREGAVDFANLASRVVLAKLPDAARIGSRRFLRR